MIITYTKLYINIGFITYFAEAYSVVEKGIFIKSLWYHPYKMIFLQFNKNS